MSQVMEQFEPDDGNFGRAISAFLGANTRLRYVTHSFVSATAMLVLFADEADITIADGRPAVVTPQALPDGFIGAGTLAVLASDIAEETGDDTTSSASDVLMAGMTLTPGAGTYLVWFSGSGHHTNASSQIITSIYAGGVQVRSSEREFQRGGAAADIHASFMSAAKVTVGATDDIEGRWRTDAAGAVVHERNLLILRIA